MLIQIIFTYQIEIVDIKAMNKQVNILKKGYTGH